MALKKSELYSSLWSSCDELRGGMDASQYKDYVLVLLFIKYVSDKYAGVPYAPITIPRGASFKDMVALKGKSDIGDQINKKIIEPLEKANKLSDMPDFNAEKLGSGKEKVERLTNLIAIFENKALDFSKNRAEGDDILGDAYEYLMRHFATESGKSKGQFYTPAEVSRIMAHIIGIRDAVTTTSTTVYDPTCGSGSLLLKVADAASAKVTLYGQEKDAATAGLARMNMILHNNPGALIVQGNTLADPKFEDGYEADMRHLIDTYIEADEPRKISPFDNMSLLELIVKTGIADAINRLPDGIKSSRGAIAETIENNVRSKIVKEHLNDPAFYDTMSALLDEIIAARKAKAIEYEEYLKRIAELAKRVEAGQAEDTPEQVNTPGRRALYNNLNQDRDLALRIDEAVKQTRPDGWRGVQAREQVIKRALYDVLQDASEVERIFLIVKQQREY